MRASALCINVIVFLVLAGWSAASQAAGRNSTAVKNGHCPRRLTVVPSKRACTCDTDCPGHDKCCVFDCGAVCVPPAFTKPGVCPQRKRGFGMCAEFCANDSDCPKDEKCCFNGCGHQCTAPYTGSQVAGANPGNIGPMTGTNPGRVASPSQVKPGRCTRPKGTPMCAEFCYHDGQCPGEQKCCRTTCGHACSEPC